MGDFGENLVCNLLSLSGFEVSLIDHTGIDVVAYNHKTRRRLGLSVKSRTRDNGKEKEPVNIFKENDRKKIIDACNSFACEPWIAIYVETPNFADFCSLDG